LFSILQDIELEYLYNLARCGNGAGCIVEIGTWAGGSAVALALGCRDSGRASVYTFDPMVKSEARFNLETHGVQDLVTVFKLYSREGAVSWPYLSSGSPLIRLLWIDGDHQYEGVNADILHWKDYLEPGGTICFHDYTENTPGVIRAVYEQVISSDQFHNFTRVGAIFSAVKREQ
jgi:predicted O-methyltransferase YrrM